MTTPQPDIDPSLSVNEIIRRWPAVMGVLNAFGVDSCCGGADPLTVAAAEADAPLEDLLTALRDVVAGSAPAGRPA